MFRLVSVDYLVFIMNSHCVQAIQYLYDQQHSVAVHYEGLPAANRLVSIKLSKVDTYQLIFKLEEVDNYQFSYTGVIDQAVFNQMKIEQSLEVKFNEIPSQIVKMFRATIDQNMFLKLEANADTCKLIFYEKSPWKPLVWLTLDLQRTNQAEIIEEMSRKLMQIKEANRFMKQQLDSSRGEISHLTLSLKNIQLNNTQLESTFHEQITLISRAFTSAFANVEMSVNEKLLKFSSRLAKLQNDMLVLKNQAKIKSDSNLRLATSFHTLRLENERNVKLLDEFKVEVNHLRLLKCNVEEELAQTRQNIEKKQSECEGLAKQITELKYDLQEATFLIAQKGKMHDEIAKDLVQANNMLVNFNHQYDTLSEEVEALHRTSTQKDQQIDELSKQKEQALRDLETYRTEYGAERLKALQHEVFVAKRAQQEIEKQHKEAIKLNNLLTKKLSDTPNVISNRLPSQTCNSQLQPPSQRSNY